jgi:hypothetical protein
LSTPRPSIGTKHESSLHRALKFRYAGASGETEAEIGGFVADGVSVEGEFIEVQTGSFGPLRKKAPALAARGRLRIIHPVMVSKFIEVYEPGGGRGVGKRLYRRKSPRKGSPWDLFDSLLYAPELPLIPGIGIELALVDVVEKRLRDGKGSWRRKGVSIIDREIGAWHGSVHLESPGDYLRFAPFKKNEEFTTARLAERVNINVCLARKTLYVLTKMGIVKRVGKKGTAFVYRTRPSRN